MNTTKKWTDDQISAITESSSSLLVSAAAGSGKTAVLTERIIRKLTDIDNPSDISRMLVVTFTKAAASELKERISKALLSAMAEFPSNKHLQRQYVLLGKARISTIHSFCLDIIKQNFQKLGLSPTVKVSEGSQTDLMISQIMDSVLESYYNAPAELSDIKDFPAFADLFITVQDDRLVDKLIEVYKKIRSYPEGVEFLKISADELERNAGCDFFTTKWGEAVKRDIRGMLCCHKEIFGHAVEYIKSETDFLPYLASFEYDLSFTSGLLELLDKADTDTLAAAFRSYSPIALKRVKSEYQTDEILRYREYRSKFSDKLDSYAERFFSSDSRQITGMAHRSASFIRDLYKILKAFETRYIYEKQLRGLLDYADLEHYSLRLLYDREKPSAEAGAISARFDEIYIDEYQDINIIQDRIFKAISEKTPRFMVGDIKQSIYGFRGAEPSLFANYRLDNSVRTIYLRHNFRCDKTIIGFVNNICGYLFKRGITVPYTSGDELVFGKQTDNEPRKVEIAVVRSEDNDGDDDESPKVNEAVFVAEKIKALISEGYRPKDIAILMRSALRSASVYEEAFENAGIPYFNQIEKNLFENPEVLLVMCLLNCIDNPSRDIYLAGVLKSPIYGVTLDELITIRKYCGEGTLYHALRKYTEETGFEKGRYFLDKLAGYRKYAAEPVDRLIWKLYLDTGVMSMIYSDSGVLPQMRKANLMLLYDYARKFESGSFKGLYNFIRYINDILDSKAAFDNAHAFAESGDTVKIMTVHQSKGLEFPVCFLCDTGSAFNRTDKYQKVMLDKDLGAAMKLPDQTGFATCDTLYRQALALRSDENLIEEEMRVLYVALTRSINRLIITASSKDPDKLIDECRQNTEINGEGSLYTLSKSPCFIKWILSARFATGDDNSIFYTVSDVSAAPPVRSDTVPRAIGYTEKDVAETEQELTKRFSYVYPYKAVSALPAKLSVSELYPAVLDEDDTSLMLFKEKADSIKKPRFLELNPDNFSSAERGTATHLFMQFCDFKKTEANGIEAERERLVANNFIPRELADIIYISYIERFFSSLLYQSMKKARQIWRELRFNIKLPASDFTEVNKAEYANEEILVQGVIDCVYIDEYGRLTVVDYKTDHIPKELTADVEKAEKMLRERHSLQLGYYRLAAEKMLCRRVDRVYLYSFALGKVIGI